MLLIKYEDRYIFFISGFASGSVGGGVSGFVSGVTFGAALVSDSSAGWSEAAGLSVCFCQNGSAPQLGLLTLGQLCGSKPMAVSIFDLSALRIRCLWS